MVNKKDRRNSGRVFPKVLDVCNSHLIQPFWDDWRDWRDGMRFNFSKSWKDITKKRKQYSQNGKEKNSK